jgi:hypothetical protein
MTVAERKRESRARKRGAEVGGRDDEGEIVNPHKGYGWSKEREAVWQSFVLAGRTDEARRVFTRESFPHLVKT